MQENLLHDLSENRSEERTISRTFEQLFPDQNSFTLAFLGNQQPITSCHPPVKEILQLWQIYVDNVEPLIKIMHVPSVQSRLIRTVTNLQQACKSMEALMFAIYTMAVVSMSEEEAQNMFMSPKKEVLGFYVSTLQQALHNAGFLQNKDFTCLQAYVLYLVCECLGVVNCCARRAYLHRLIE